MKANEINEHHGIDGAIHFSEEQHTVVANIKSVYSQAKVSLYGAQVLSFIPNGEEDILFVSNDAYFKEGKAIRGGIPICWPWFNAHPVNPDLPSHGFARISTWKVHSTKVIEDEVILDMFLTSNEDTQKLFPYDFELHAEIRVGKKLVVSLSTHNKGDEKIEISSALHTYLKVSDISNIGLKGLQNTFYVDDVLKCEAKQAEDILLINKRIDRQYCATTSDCLLVDKNRNIRIAKKGSAITVVWNPGQELTLQMADLGNDDYRHMLCVEAANNLEDTITVQPGHKHTLETIISID